MAEATLKISDYYGRVNKCFCTNPEIPASCTRCFARGYTAECLACQGKGQVKATVAGAPGEMRSTCSVCGGTGGFGVNKPENFELICAAREAVERGETAEVKPESQAEQQLETVA